jgi:hypothetical protein
VLNAIRPASGTVPDAQLNSLLAVLDGARPKDEIEAMLISQMVAVHHHAMDQLGKAARSATIDQVNVHSNFAIKLMRTHVAQVEALAKLRRGGEQTVRVEHVHVHKGGQAIVGTVTAGGGAALGNIGQCDDATDERTLAFAPGSPVWSEEPGGAALPDGEGQGPEPMPASWRGRGDRGAEG